MTTTSLDKSSQLDFSGDAILATDFVASGKIYAGGVEITSTEIGFLDGVTAGIATASKAVVLGASKEIATITTATITNLTSTAATIATTTGNLVGSINPAVVLTKGAGVSAMETHASSVSTTGTIKTTRIIIDLTGLVASATDTDIIGNTGGAASAHIGQVTAAINGTLVGGRITCLEVPAGGADDIDFYSATVSTGAQDGLITDLTETVLITSGGAWASGTVKGMTGLPPANDYLYVCAGEASAGTYTAGKFLIELFGT